MATLPAYQRNFKGKPLFFFVDATTCQPISKRVKWTQPAKGAWPSVLNESFGSIWSAAAWVAEKIQFEPADHHRHAMQVLQTESGLPPEVFNFATHPWLDYFHSPELLGPVVESVPVHLRENVDRFLTWEACTKSHVQEYDKFLRGKLATAAERWAKNALDHEQPHYPLSYVPVTLPDGPLPPDVVGCTGFAHWLFERAQLGPLQVAAGPHQLLWVSRNDGVKNSNASYGLGDVVSGEAWAVALQPVFPIPKHGQPKESSGVSGRRRGAKASASTVNGGGQSRKTAHPRGRK